MNDQKLTSFTEDIKRQAQFRKVEGRGMKAEVKNKFILPLREASLIPPKLGDEEQEYRKFRRMPAG